MIAQLVAFMVGSILSMPAPTTLNDSSRLITAIIPEGEVLAAQIEKREGAPTKTLETEPTVSAESYVIIDVASGSVIASRNPSAVRPVASLTKLLTALTVEQKANSDDIVTVGRNVLKAEREGSDMQLKPGEKIRVQDLLAGLLISSANDAAVALAEHISGSERQFAEEMNAVALSYGLARTHAVNATGFDNKQHFSSAYDMGLLLLHAWRDPVLGLYLRTSSQTVTSVDGSQKHFLKTTNRLLGERTDILAGKTGFTDAAGQSLAIVAENENGNPVIAVLLGSKDRFTDMNHLLNWTFKTFKWSDN